MMSKQRALACSALILLAGTALSACSKEESKTNTPSVTSNASQKPDDTAMSKPLELSVAVWDIETGFNASNAKNDTVYNDLTKKFNITIKPVQITWNDWQEKAKVWAASKQLPDMFANEVDMGLYQTWAKQGVIKPLPDDLSPYPNLKKLFSSPAVEPALQPLKVDGKYYAVPRFGGEDIGDGRLGRPIRYRKDWAEEAGFTKEPASFDEFLAMTKAVIQKHPGVTGLTINSKGYLLTQFLGSFPEMVFSNNWTQENGKWIPAFTSEKAYPGIKQLRTLYSEGILDKDFAIQKDADGTNKFLSGQSFALYGMEGVTDEQVSAFKKANPGVSPSKAMGYLNIWPAADGKRYSTAGAPFWSNTFFASTISDDKFKRSLQVLDYMLSDEYRILGINGIENIDYKVENGQYVSLLKAGETLADKYPITSKLVWLAAWDPLLYKGKKVVSSDPEGAALLKLQIETWNRYKQENTLMPVNFDFNAISTPAKNKFAALDPDIQNDIIKVILGKGDPIAQWKEIVKSYDSKGVPEAIKEVNDEVAKRGIK
ncbi:putative aldouronate transport system substrate-binding protein [Paenibacillus sp. V4I3]|uniref:extracellular solute-binding protein n=1 Tax=unclassified Paenibacillus TaxID=185978 RepID=UPI002780528D|nr:MULTISPECIES: extracellular solute-binding protein [unclassified Paenibacillus]MDQ0877742.1 putative aldouronate transport system substrate-binding protein [Paenibacillus sp. V4I3]MDQ0886383.1 putative aldouronate transport system substrate-binding protein [Paenibacillus sp. V4I9]